MRIDGAELADTLARAVLASGPIHNTAQVVAHPHTQHRQMIVEKESVSYTHLTLPTILLV